MARPYSASTIAYATSFFYEQGVLCYSTTDSIRILNLGVGSQVEKIISAKFFSQKIAVPGETASSPTLKPRKLTLLGYSNEVLTVLCEFGSTKGSFLFAVNIADSNERPRCLLKHRLRVTDQLFARHDEQYLYCGTLSARGSHGHQEWLIQGFDFSSGEKLTDEPVQLHDFAGSDVGTSVAFTIHDGHFYALSNQASHESEEVSWTSYYHYIKLAVDDKDPKIEIKTIYRRQDNEGPINDAWTDLEFQIDHRTGELLIVEGRKEWVGGASSAVRTYYVQPWNRADHDNWNRANSVNPNDQVRLTVTDKDKARYEMAPHQRVAKYTHVEFGEVNTPKRKEYLRAKTKWNGYDFNNQCYVDLVVDEVGDEGSWRKKERVRLRLVSRRSEPPVFWTAESAEDTGVLKYEMRTGFNDRDGEYVRDSEEVFSDSEIHLWPPDDTELPKELDEILCPGGKASDVKARIGEEGIVYMVGPTAQTNGNGGQGEERALVFLSFEPNWGFEGMKRTNGELAQQRKQTCSGNAASGCGNGEKRKSGVQDHDTTSKRQKCQGAPAVDGKTTVAAPPSKQASESGSTRTPSASNTMSRERLLWMEKARFLSISKGFWLGSPRMKAR